MTIEQVMKEIDVVCESVTNCDELNTMQKEEFISDLTAVQFNWNRTIGEGQDEN